MSSRRRLATLGVAVGGVLAGHWLVYATVTPHQHAREALLARTGHAYLGWANDLGLILTLAALSAVFLGRLTHREGGAPWPSLAVRLGAFQVTAFLAMEVLERATSGVPLGHLLDRGLLATGIAIQVGVAMLVAIVIRTVLRAADGVAARRATTAPIPPRTSVSALLPSTPLVRRRFLSTAVGVRGPPHV